MLETKLKEGQERAFPRLLVTRDGRDLGIMVKAIHIDRGRVHIGFDLLENGHPIIRDEQESACNPPAD